MLGFFIFTILCVIVLIVLLWLRSPRVQCPTCQSGNVRLINRDVQDVRPYDLISGEGGGKMLMMEIKETFRCSQCEYTWVRTRTEA